MLSTIKYICFFYIIPFKLNLEHWFSYGFWQSFRLFELFHEWHMGSAKLISCSLTKIERFTTFQSIFLCIYHTTTLHEEIHIMFPVNLKNLLTISPLGIQRNKCPKSPIVLVEIFQRFLDEIRCFIFFFYDRSVSCLRRRLLLLCIRQSKTREKLKKWIL